MIMMIGMMLLMLVITDEAEDETDQRKRVDVLIVMIRSDEDSVVQYNSHI